MLMSLCSSFFFLCATVRTLVTSFRFIPCFITVNMFKWHEEQPGWHILKNTVLFSAVRQAIIQERKRYGFVLERQTSLSKHFLAHYGKGAALLEKHLDGWQETSKSREELPSSVEFLLGQQNMVSNAQNCFIFEFLQKSVHLPESWEAVVISSWINRQMALRSHF